MVELRQKVRYQTVPSGWSNLAGSRLSSGIIRLPPDNEYIRDRTYIR